MKIPGFIGDEPLTYRISEKSIISYQLSTGNE